MNWPEVIRPTSLAGTGSTANARLRPLLAEGVNKPRGLRGMSGALPNCESSSCDNATETGADVDGTT